MKEIVGEETYVNVGNLIGSGRMSRRGIGKIIKKYNGWYLVEVGEGERKYRTGIAEMEIKLVKKEKGEGG